MFQRLWSLVEDHFVAWSLNLLRGSRDNTILPREVLRGRHIWSPRRSRFPSFITPLFRVWSKMRYASIGRQRVTVFGHWLRLDAMYDIAYDTIVWSHGMTQMKSTENTCNGTWRGSPQIFWMFGHRVAGQKITWSVPFWANRNWRF